MFKVESVTVKNELSEIVVGRHHFDDIVKIAVVDPSRNTSPQLVIMLDEAELVFEALGQYLTVLEKFN